MCITTGIAGDYMLDEYGDRDVVFSLIYTNTDNKVSNKSLFAKKILKLWESFIKPLILYWQRAHTVTKVLDAINLCYQT